MKSPNKNCSLKIFQSQAAWGQQTVDRSAKKTNPRGIMDNDSGLDPLLIKGGVNV